MTYTYSGSTAILTLDTPVRNRSAPFNKQSLHSSHIPISAGVFSFGSRGIDMHSSRIYSDKSLQVNQIFIRPDEKADAISFVKILDIFRTLKSGSYSGGLVRSISDVTVVLHEEVTKLVLDSHETQLASQIEDGNPKLVFLGNQAEEAAFAFLKANRKNSNKSWNIVFLPTPSEDQERYEEEGNKPKKVFDGTGEVSVYPYTLGKFGRKLVSVNDWASWQVQ